MYGVASFSSPYPRAAAAPPPPLSRAGAPAPNLPVLVNNSLVGRVTMNVYWRVAFSTVERYHSLCAGERGFDSKRCSLRCIVEDFLIQGQSVFRQGLINMLSNEEEFDDTESNMSDFFIEIEKGGGNNNRQRRIQSRVPVRAALDTVWRILTDYEGLSDFIPSLAVSRLLDKKDKFAKLYQVGQQDLALGFKFNAKGVIECYEGDLELLPSGQLKRDISFKMVDGDFRIFEGKWSIEQADCDKNSSEEQNEPQSTLIYTVDLEPKLWLPVGLVEGRVCKEIKNNLLSVKEEAQRVQKQRAKASKSL